MTRWKPKKDMDSEQIRQITCCGNLPTTSKLDRTECCGIFQAISSEDHDAEPGCATVEITCAGSLITSCKKISSSPNKYVQSRQPTDKILFDSENYLTEPPENSQNEEKILSESKRMRIWRAEKRKTIWKWNAEKWRNGSKIWDFDWKWCKLRSFSLILLLLITYYPAKASTAKSRNSIIGYCEPQSVPLHVTPRAVASLTAALFARPCRCAPDWRSHFCAQVPRYKSLLAVPERHREEEDQLPTVCVCRQITPENNCQQFMTQCFFAAANKHNECMCCFNQPSPFCNQLQCQNGEPVFGVRANTTCICHTPTFYPYSICAHQASLFYDQEEEEATISSNSDTEMPHYIRYPLRGSPMQQEESSAMALYGLQITPAMAVTIVLGLLGAVVLLTMVLLVVRTCRTHREHRNRAAKREMAQSVLLEQRAEDEKYLP